MGLFGRSKGAGPDRNPSGPQREGGATHVSFRNDYYRDQYRNMAGIGRYGTIALLLSVFMNAFLSYEILHRRPIYFATTRDGRIIPLVPLSRPEFSNRTVIEWATARAVDAYSYDFVNWRERLTGIAKDFTAVGYSSFVASLKTSGNLSLAIKEKRVVSAAPSGAGVLVAKGLLNGSYAWKVEVPIVVSYQVARNTVSQNVLVTLLIVRRSLVTHPSGMAIAQFISEEKKL
jgi:intracellular multiplication protein IcmL